MNARNIPILITIVAFMLLGGVRHCMAEVGADENFRVGQELLKEKKFDEAITQFKKAIEKDPSRTEFYRRLAQAYGKKMMLDEAAKTYEKGIKLDPSDVQARNNLGVIYDTMDMPNEAIAQYKEAVRIDPSYVEAYNNMAVAYMRGGRLEEALKALQQALKIDPKHAQAHYNTGIVYTQMGYKDKAINEYKRAVELNPRYSEAYNNLGILLEKLGRGEDAAVQWKKAIEANPEYVDGYYNLGAYYFNREEYGGPAEKLPNLPPGVTFDKHLEDIIQYDPSTQLLGLKSIITEKEKEELINLSEDAAYRKAIQSLYDRRLEGALPLWKKLVELTPKDPWTHWRLGAVYARLSMVKEAKNEEKLFKELVPKSEEYE